MIATNGGRYCLVNAEEIDVGVDGKAAPSSKYKQMYERDPADGRRKIIHIFGCPNSGKTTLRKALKERHPDYPSYCIDDFRRRYGDGTFRGEYNAQVRFGDAMWEGGFFECSGAGGFTRENLSAYRYRPQYIVVLDATAEECISRMAPGKYAGIPFPFPDTDEHFIRKVSDYLSSEIFAYACRGIPTLWLDSDIPLDAQIQEVERFTGLDVQADSRSDSIKDGEYGNRTSLPQRTGYQAVAGLLLLQLPHRFRTARAEGPHGLPD